MVKRILVASDLSDLSRPALRMALHLGCELKATVVALHVIEQALEGGQNLASLFEDDGQLSAAAIKREEQAARRRLEEQTVEELTHRHAPPVTEAIVRSGDIANTIVATAAAGEADLVVLGVGRDGRLGSVAERVMRNASRPVLAVPA
jgi:nucleotide-binding universal stress UspA family protein